MSETEETKNKETPTEEFGKRSLTWGNIRLGWGEIGIKTKIKIVVLLATVIGLFGFAVWWILFWIRALG